MRNSDNGLSALLDTNILKYEGLKVRQLQWKNKSYLSYEQFVSKGLDYLNDARQKGAIGVKQANNFALFLFEAGYKDQARDILSKLKQELSAYSTTLEAVIHRKVTTNLQLIEREPIRQSDLVTKNGESPSYTPVEKMYFIGGTGRCGSTLLMHVLDDHPEVECFGETKFAESTFLREFLTCLHDLDSEAKAYFLKELKVFLLTSWYRRPTGTVEDVGYDWGYYYWFSRDDIRDGFPILDKLPEASSKQEVHRIFGQFLSYLFSIVADNYGVDILVEKTPRNLGWASTLNNFFSDMKFIHIFRDGRDVLCSKASGLNSPPYFEESTQFEQIDGGWGKMILDGFSELSAIDTKDHRHIKYEHFVQNPEESLKKLCRFLKVSFSDEMMDREFRTDSIGRFKNEFDTESLKYFENKYGSLLQILGYDCDLSAESIYDSIKHIDADNPNRLVEVIIDAVANLGEGYPKNWDSVNGLAGKIAALLNNDEALTDKQVDQLHQIQAIY